jgi:hypothetical protein
MAKDYYLRPSGDDSAHGQPNSNFNKALRCERGIDEMLGICKGILADGTVVEAEAQYLFSWIKENPDVCSAFPGKLLADRLGRIFLDGVCSETERLELNELLSGFTGQNTKLPKGKAGATRIIFEDPEPPVVFPGKLFSFTGKFVSGTRAWCAEQTTKRGGIFHERPTALTSFLVVGTGGSRDWIHSAYGRKIEAAAEYRDKYGVKIVSEEHWVTFL